MQINFGLKTVSCKIVYYGPGLSGKTTNIQMIHDQMPGDRRGELTSIKTKGDRTLFFDFMAFDLGKVAGMDTRFQIYTVPGQVFYNATRKLVLQGADGIVFVADSAPDRLQANVDSWRNLQENLAERHLSLHDLPVVIQWNKRDLPDAVPTDELHHSINVNGAPTFEAVAFRGEGVLNTLKGICTLVCKSIDVSRHKSGVPLRGETEAAGAVPALVASQPVAAREMRFVSRRMSAFGAASVPQAPVMAVDEARTDAAAVEVRQLSPVSPGIGDVPTPPRTARRVDTFVGTAPRKHRRSVRRKVVVAAAAIAAAAGAALLLHALGIL